MRNAKLLWTEYPYDAGFCITDDTDAATFEQTKAVYDFLLQHQFVTTKTVWCFEPVEPCGIPATPDSTVRGITLEDPQYLQYCKMLGSKGYEICLHGASAGNNKRKSIVDAFETLAKEFGNSDTFICHSKNADNIYWEDKVTRLFPFNVLLKRQSKYDTFGEDENSPYFWGDICQSMIKQIRLFRTRNVNTLKVNPSMPYHDENKPYVNYWFSATKRRIADCAQDNALRKLQEKNGLTVLYQYLHRYADCKTGKLNSDFVAAIQRLSSEKGLHITTVSNHMNRLRAIRNIVVVKYGNTYGVINSNSAAVRNLQFSICSNRSLEIASNGIGQIGDRIVIANMEPKTALQFGFSDSLRFNNCVYAEFKSRQPRIFQTPACGVRVWIPEVPDESPSCSNAVFQHQFMERTDENKGLENIPMLEEYRLVVGQMSIILREILFKGRKLDSNKYLDATKEIKLENHDNW